MSLVGAILLAVVAYLAGRCNGWLAAHKTIATECERLGAFYCGSRVFKCTKITTVTKEPDDAGQDSGNP